MEHVVEPQLHLFCGKAGSGKSTLARRLGAASDAVLIAEDAWLSALFKDEMSSLQDYVRCSGKLRSVMQPHVMQLLRAGVSVVLDYPANTPQTRVWMQELVAATGVGHVMHVFDIPDALCLSRLKARFENGEHPFEVTEAQFRQLAQHFVAPQPDEGFTLLHHTETS